ncbi:hypothetical protein B484DRAFT_45470 [Ochromonadaceae sp. CCMP2298]|nr:hypothetical protein B484DRAFT_45470 [Ochromonadaceae sp. CCMP2298]
MQVVNGPSEPKSEPSSVLMLVSVSASAPASALVSASEPTSAVPEEREGYRVRWVASSVACPVYLLGRYRKLARDVPQAAWTVSTNAAAGDGEDRDRDGDERDESNNKNSNSNSNNKDFNSRSSKTADPSREIRYERKGRCSVEEIVSHALQTYLPADAVRLHPCGREDINVRCLGNGRPFALEVLNPSILYPSLSLLQSVVRMVNSGQGLNQDRDVELALLAPAGKSLWEEMQTKAEEKRKGYRCVVWSEKAVTQSQLRELERLCSSGQTRDAEGDACIELTQKTPLRVLHRRSLLDRIRYVYDLQCVQINQHWFVMDIVTSAGTYVKEFVHGDLGRTLPSVSSVLQCHCDIQQLDVTWLYDDLEGSDPAQLIDADADASVATDTVITGAETTTLSWDALKAIKFAGLGSRSGTAKQEQ